jgi:hypothetical protein
MEHGKLTWRGNKLCYAVASNSYFDPERITHVWHLETWPPPMDDEDREIRKKYEGMETVAFRSFGGNWEVRIPCGSSSRAVILSGSAKAIETHTDPVPRPKTTKETRWKDGRWEKLLKTRGWVPA